MAPLDHLDFVDPFPEYDHALVHKLPARVVVVVVIVVTVGSS